MQSVLKILFVDDHTGLREGLSYLLQQKNSHFEIYTAGNGEEALSILQENPEIQISVLDLNLGSETGVNLIPQLRKINPELKIIIYTMYNDPIHIELSLQNGIQGYITKEADIGQLGKAIISVSDGNIFLNKQASAVMNSMLQGGRQKSENSESREILLFENYKTLTKKEQEIFSLLAQKKETYDIARLLGKSEKTVINQKSMIYQKLNLRDRLDLIESAKILGVIL